MTYESIKPNKLIWGGDSAKNYVHNKKKKKSKTKYPSTVFYLAVN